MVSGKRKTAVAKARVRTGKGNIVYNGIPYTELRIFHKLSLMEPVEICRKIIGHFNFDIEVKATGGGTEGQIQAARLAIAKGLVKFTESQDLRKAIIDYDRNMLVADVRRKETRKPGDSKARAMRQTSYR
ncbi:30S ribosomal protein S9 [Candidatus Pacearchaeota archaeon CG1_02_39_14]|nr:MAG: 30S ribosomal protein S9 [Candidatus Pacearchaeota archaeon CG1_02_39_14]